MFSDVVLAIHKPKKWQECFQPDKTKIPLYGPLNFESIDSYLENAKEIFHKAYKMPFQYQLKVENFEPIYQVGEGGFGKVLLVKYTKFNSYYAMKCQLKSYLVKNQCVAKILQEKRMLQSMNCPFCIFLMYFSQDNSYIYFILPFVSGGELYTHLVELRRFEENLAKFYAAQVILALEYLHACDVVYRDLKPENVLLDHLGYIKITDFGLSKIVRKRTYTFCGTPDYIAPEIILGIGYGKAVDWWSFGAFVFELCSGRPPFFCKSHYETFKKILALDYRLPLFFSKDLKILIEGLFQTDVTKRLGNMKDGIAEIKQQKWFEKIDWLYLFNRRMEPPYIPPAAQDLSSDYFPNIIKAEPLRVDSEPLFDAYFDDF